MATDVNPRLELKITIDHYRNMAFVPVVYRFIDKIIFLLRHGPCRTVCQSSDLKFKGNVVSPHLGFLLLNIT